MARSFLGGREQAPDEIASHVPMQPGFSNGAATNQRHQAYTTENLEKSASSDVLAVSYK
jgi:hypothetical protein